MVAGARVEVAPYKRDPADFVLWKPSGEDVIGWDSPWGRGRPGWHIECSAMIKRHLGETIDIHGGGLDLIFPHHENEIAQSRCAHGGAPLARYWVHNGFVDMGAEKMSKCARQYRHAGGAAGAGPSRRDAAASVAERALSPAAAVDRDAGAQPRRARPAVSKVGELKRATGRYRRGVLEALSDDLNTPLALSRLIGARRPKELKAQRAALLGMLRRGKVFHEFLAALIWFHWAGDC